MKLINRYFGLFAVITLLGALLFVSCDKGGGPTDPTDPENPNTEGTNIDADKLSEYLVLTDATRITDDMPTAPDNQLKINFKDSIFVMKSFPYGARVAVLHEGRYDIAGFYVWVSGSSFYYNVPVVETEAQDSTDVFYINMEIPESDDVEYPFTISIKILPYDPDGTPLDEFSEELTSEDPEQVADCRPITTPAGEIPSPFIWKWVYTVGELYNGEVLYEAPSEPKILSYQTGGCCNEDGSSSTVGNDPYCFEKFSDGTSNPKWRSIDVETYFMWNFDVLEFFDDGTFLHENESEQTNYRPSLSNFCTGVAAYDQQEGYFLKYGTHDFTPGTDYLNIAYNPTNPPVFGKTIRSGNIQYTCQLLSFEFGGEDKFTALFSKHLYIHGKYRNWWD